ncbi:MAG TPA: serine/threonine-protein kinase [Pseudonocardiaceae bacterium]|nr:serine/threonine-protein kinase [Pseudonocardiaceae bacterium]
MSAIPDEPDDLRAFEGRTVAGTYLLREHLGSGGFGGVFLSDQYVLGQPLRRVALKLSRRTHMSQENTRDALADAFVLAGAMDKIADQQSRMHLVHIYDAGIAAELDDRWFLTMEFVDGHTLDDEFDSFQGGRVPAEALMKWARQIALALRGLHQLTPPLLHRDLKPSNVLLGVDNVIRLVDFGLSAKMVQLGHIPGTVGVLDHMSPETAVGRSSPASDIYSLGLLIYQGLTGELPFRHLVPPVNLPDSVHGEWLYEAKRNYRPAPPSALNSSVSAPLDEFVLNCLAHDPSNRFGDAAELLDALDNLGKPPARAADQAREQARALRAENKLDEALRVLEHELENPTLTRDERFWLARDKGEVLDLLGDPAGAAAAFTTAWALCAKTAILRTLAERVELLEALIASYRGAGNPFQVHRYEGIRARELGGGQ